WEKINVWYTKTVKNAILILIMILVAGYNGTDYKPISSSIRISSEFSMRDIQIIIESVDVAFDAVGRVPEISITDFNPNILKSPEACKKYKKKESTNAYTSLHKMNKAIIVFCYDLDIADEFRHVIMHELGHA